ncbi:diaminopropionate ammonia-lyase [Ilumatobacter sp.]|uniref:diaminopropionate ammonia-lyase n=1 Tax=Ilumatobacter sp. TaxID=1967498 RepID=UPI003C6F236C
MTRNPMREARSWPPAPTAVADFHRRMPAYDPSLLFDAPDLAADLGIGRLLIKTETRRMGLPSFKILGASWATYQAICAHMGREPGPWENINDLAAEFAHLKPFELATATDGNHGRAVAFMARLLGFQAEIFVPTGMAQARIEAMESEGATVTVVDGDYDDAVARSSQEANERCLVVSDTSWPGYEATPAHVIDGYSTIFAEVDHAIDATGLSHPDVVVVPMGVGAFMAAAVTHYRDDHRGPTVIAGVEPLDANCVQTSALAGAPTQVPGPHESIMVGLNCGMPSPIAWPRLAAGVDWFVSVDDDAARQAMRDLADAAVVAGETGAASLAGLRALLSDTSAIDDLPDKGNATALIIVTEGATDPCAYRRIVGRGMDSVGRVVTAMR